MKDESACLNGTRVAWSCIGAGPALVLLHGFPQTRALWWRIAPILARHFTVIAPDLRGYGASGKPEGVGCYSFREMAGDILALMDHLGHARFALAGHDRGGRVAHRLALDAPARLTRLCLMDIVPTHTILSDLRLEVAHAYYHWFFLAQPAPFPETMIGHDPDGYFETCLLGWGGARLSDFDPEQLAAYRSAWRDPETIRAMCDDYRAAVSQDMANDRADLQERIACPVLVLYGAQGVMARCYDVPATWRDKCASLQAAALPGGHFFVDTAPDETAQALRSFMGVTD